MEIDLPPLALSDLRGQLIRLEETIIFALIERAQFARNAPVYTPGAAAVFGAGAQPATLGESFGGSFLDYMLRETERLHSLVRRYLSPDEVAFFPDDLPAPILPTLNATAAIKPNAININAKIKSVYERSILAQMPLAGEDGHVGASAVCDISALQALSKRIHYGKFIAEAKFQANRVEYSAMIRARDAAGLMAALTKPEVEVAVLERVRLKASTYGQDPQVSAMDGDGPSYKLAPDAIMALYRDWVMPLTKEVQVAYLLQRLEPSTVALVVSRRSNAALGGESAAALGGAAPAVQPHAHIRRCLEGTATDGGDGYRYRGYGSAAAVLDAVKSNAADAGVVHLESSDLGVHRATQRALIDSGLYIRAEIWRDVRCAVARRKEEVWPPAPPFTAATARWQVFGTARVLSRCSEWLRATLPVDVKCERVDVDSDAEALAAAAGGDASRIAIISLVEDDDALNSSSSALHPTLVIETIVGCRARERLVVLGKSYDGPSAFDQTALCFDIGGSHPGDLSRALQAFQKHGVDLDQIQSLALASGAGYRFYVELAGHASEAHIALALDALRALIGAERVRVLGCFMRHNVSGGGAPQRGDDAVLESSTPSEASGDAEAVAAAAAAGGDGVLSSRDAVWHFLGPKATFTHAATSALVARFAPPTTAGGVAASQFQPCDRIAAVFDAVLASPHACGVVPIENSTAGAVLETIDLLIRHAGALRIVAQHLRPIEHCLFSHAANAAAVVEVLSKDQVRMRDDGEDVYLLQSSHVVSLRGCAPHPRYTFSRFPKTPSCSMYYLSPPHPPPRHRPSRRVAAGSTPTRPRRGAQRAPRLRSRYSAQRALIHQRGSRRLEQPSQERCTAWRCCTVGFKTAMIMQRDSSRSCGRKR